MISLIIALAEFLHFKPVARISVLRRQTHFKGERFCFCCMFRKKISGKLKNLRAQKVGRALPPISPPRLGDCPILQLNVSIVLMKEEISS